MSSQPTAPTTRHQPQPSPGAGDVVASDLMPEVVPVDRAERDEARVDRQVRLALELAALREGMSDVIREARAAALRDVALAWQTKGWADALIPMPTQGVPSIAVAQVVTDWLRARAEQEATS